MAGSVKTLESHTKSRVLLADIWQIKEKRTSQLVNFFVRFPLLPAVRCVDIAKKNLDVSKFRKFFQRNKKLEATRILLFACILNSLIALDAASNKLKERKLKKKKTEAAD